MSTVEKTFGSISKFLRWKLGIFVLIPLITLQTDFQHNRYNPLKGDWVLVCPQRE